MPFKSKSQMRACFAKKDPSWDCHKWAKETGSTKSLPERKKKKNYGGMMDYRRKKCMKCGGKPKYQAGGSVPPKQQDYPDYESWQAAMDEYMATMNRQMLPNIKIPQQAPISQSDFLPEEGVSPSTTTPDQGVLEPRVVDDIDAEANRLYETGSRQYQQAYDKDLGMSVLDNGTASERRSYRNFYRGKYGEAINPIDPFQVALGITGAKAGLSWLSGVIDRRRQRRYMQNQYSTLGQNTGIPVSNFQPSPYNLYAKLGGNIKRYMFTNNAENKAFPVDAGRMRKGGKWIQKAINPEHKGYCTPMTKSTCTPRRKALARTFKKHHGFHGS